MSDRYFGIKTFLGIGVIFHLTKSRVVDQSASVMKAILRHTVLTAVTALVFLAFTIPAEAARTGRPPVIVTTTTDVNPPVSPF
jgi:hypothetical protein